MGGSYRSDCSASVFRSLWLLGLAQRHLNRPLVWGSILARSGYGAFILQGLVLIGIAVALRPLPVPAEVKALVVGGGGVVGSFALAWFLINRLPVIGRIV